MMVVEKCMARRLDNDPEIAREDSDREEIK
jgi:hypothetical protein